MCVAFTIGLIICMYIGCPRDVEWGPFLGVCRMEANRSDAEECLAIAKQYLAKGNKVKAVKLLEKSSRLYPTQECRGEARIAL